MLKAKLHKGAWVVVCDGGKALVLENVGDEKFPNLQTRETFRHEPSPTAGQDVDPPVQGQAPAADNRLAPQEARSRDQGERGFLRKLCRYLAEAVTNGRATSLILVAPPRAMGILRDELSPAARDAVHAEMTRDLTNLPAHEIEKRLSESANV
jgi:protein required for attachment to host cells